MKNASCMLLLLCAGISTGAQAVELHGSVGAETKWIAYGVNQNPNRDGSANGTLSAVLGDGFSINGILHTIHTLGSNLREEGTVAWKGNVHGVGLYANVGHIHFNDTAGTLHDYNRYVVKAGYAGVYGKVDYRYGVKGSSADNTFYTIGYAHACTPKLKLAAEVSDRDYRAEGRTRFNDVALHAQYKWTKNIDVLGTVAHGGQTDKDADIGGVASLGMRYHF